MRVNSTRKLDVSLLLLLAVALTGCPYESSTPVAESSRRPLDEGLVGTWHCIGTGDDDAVGLSFRRVTATELEATAAGKNEDPEQYRLLGAKSGSVALVNVQAKKEGEAKPWSLVRLILLRPRVLEVEIAREEPFQAAGAASTRDVIARSLKRGDLFDAFLVCARAADEAGEAAR